MDIVDNTKVDAHTVVFFQVFGRCFFWKVFVSNFDCNTHVPVTCRLFFERDLFNGYCSELDLSEKVKTKAMEIIDVTAKKGLLSGKSPTAYAAAAIYASALLCNEKRTQREVAEVAQVTEVTIRNRYQEQIEAMELE